MANVKENLNAKIKEAENTANELAKTKLHLSKMISEMNQGDVKAKSKENEETKAVSEAKESKNNSKETSKI